MKKIAIIGSGYFGCTLAFFLSKNKNLTIDIFEKENEILRGVSSSNQQRFHKGYHYPRSPKTVFEIAHSEKDFLNFYGKDVLGKTNNYYGISKKNSRTSFSNYLSFLKDHQLKYNLINKKIFSDSVSPALKTEEKNLNFFKIKKKIIKLIQKKNINVNFNYNFKRKDFFNYDKIIIAAYDQNNRILKNLGFKNSKLEKFKYELIEKIVIKLPSKYKKNSYIVLDGKFGCVDPYLGTNYHLLSDNLLSKIEITRGYLPIFKNFKKKFINKGLVYELKNSKFKEIKNRLSKIMPFLQYAEYVGSFYATRTIKNNVEKTDERKSYFRIIDNKVITVLAGKWINCVTIAKKLRKILVV